MGFFDFLKKQKNTTYTIEQAMSLIEGEMSSAADAGKSEMYNRAEKAYACFQELLPIISNFRTLEAPPHAKGSINVKDRFCAIAEQQISELAKPDVDSAPEFLRYSFILVNRLGGLTERQLLHLKVFFKGGIGPLGAKMNEINELVKPQKDVYGSHRKAVDLHREIFHKRNEKEALVNKIHEQAQRLAELGARRSMMAVPEELADKSGLLAAEKKLQKARQEIDSFLSVQKPLKKHVHDTGVRDGLIGLYISSPSAAILEDMDLRIIDILKTVKKSAENPGKIEQIISGEEFLRAKRLELLEAMRIESEERSRYDQRSGEIAAALMNARRRQAVLEAELRDCQKSVNEYAAAMVDLEKQLSRAHIELVATASDILKANVV